MLPIKNAYAFFPNRKGLVGGLVLSSSSIGAILWSQYSTYIINPNNEKPNLIVKIGNAIEIMYSTS
jgi:hypothetical protein